MLYKTVKKMVCWISGIGSFLLIMFLALAYFIPKTSPAEERQLFAIAFVFISLIVACIVGGLTWAAFDFYWLCEGQKALDKIFNPTTPFSEALKQHTRFLFCLERSDRGYEMYTHPKHDWLELTWASLADHMYELHQTATQS